MSNIAIRSKALLKTRFAVGGLSLLFASTFAFSPAFGDNYAQTISGGTGITQPVCSIAKVSELSLASQLNLIATPASDFSSSCGGSGNNGGGGGGAGEHSFEVDPALQGTGFEQYAGDLVVVPQTGGGMRAFFRNDKIGSQPVSDALVFADDRDQQIGGLLTGMQYSVPLPYGGSSGSQPRIVSLTQFLVSPIDFGSATHCAASNLPENTYPGLTHTPFDYFDMVCGTEVIGILSNLGITFTGEELYGTNPPGGRGGFASSAGSTKWDSEFVGLASLADKLNPKELGSARAQLKVSR